MQKFEKISSQYKIDAFELIGTIVINVKKFNSMDCYDYFKDNNNFYDLDQEKDYKRLMQVINLSNQNNTEISPPKESILKTSKEINEVLGKYMLKEFEKELQNFHSLPPIEQGKLLHDIKIITKGNFFSFYKDFGINKSYVSIRIKLYNLSAEFIDSIELKNVISNLKIGIVSCFPNNNHHLKKELLEKIYLGELKEDRNEINNFINQKKFSDKEKTLDTQLIKLRSLLDKKKYIKLSDKTQQRILNHFDKIEKIIEKEG